MLTNLKIDEEEDVFDLPKNSNQMINDEVVRLGSSRKKVASRELGSFKNGGHESTQVNLFPPKRVSLHFLFLIFDKCSTSSVITRKLSPVTHLTRCCCACRYLLWSIGNDLLAGVRWKELGKEKQMQQKKSNFINFVDLIACNCGRHTVQEQQHVFCRENVKLDGTDGVVCFKPEALN